MKHKFLFILLFSLVLEGMVTTQAVAGDYVHQVNMLIGTRGTGLTSGYLYLRTTYPYGMVQLTPSYFSKRSGFVINQLSGGGCEHIGDFPTFPVKGELKMSPDNILNYRINVSEEKGHAGHYEAMVQEDIKAKLTVTERTGMISYEYPADQQHGTIIIGGGISATPIEQAAIIITASDRRKGYAEGGNFCGLHTPYEVCFAAKFDIDAFETGIWKREELMPNTTFAEGEYSGVYFTFDVSRKKSIRYKIGVSYVSVEDACEDLEVEDAKWDFQKIQNQAEVRWNHYLGMIEIEGTSPDRTTQFYTHLYCSFIHPNVCSDANGEYMGANFRVYKSRSKHYTSFSNWDTYCTQIQPLSIFDPEVVSDIVISHQLLVEQSGGSFSHWMIANIETGVVQGGPTPVLIVNTYAFGVRNYNLKPVPKIMRKGAEELGSKLQDVETRPGLKQCLDKGYYNVSIQLEYISADFAAGQFALHAVGDEFTGWRHSHFARSQKNLYNLSTGWPQSRNPDGLWKPLGEDFRGSTCKNYFWMVPYDIVGLIEIIGGKEKVEKRLDEFSTRLDAGYNGAWFAPGNEPSFYMPWIYNWTGRPYKTQEIINCMSNEQYSSKTDGLPGNDDLGTMGVWCVLACIGLYSEIPGVRGPTVNTPIFLSVKVHLKEGDIVIREGSEKDIYIKSMKLNGKSYESTWIDQDQLNSGATIGYHTSGKSDMRWGAKVVPPSFP